MARCAEIEPLIGAFEDGELEPHEMQEVARHVAQCANCETALADLATVGRLVRTAALTPSLEGLAQTVQERIARLNRPVRIRLQRFMDSVSQRWAGGLALTSAALAVAAFTAVVVTPYARYLVGPPTVASGPATSVEPKPPEPSLASVAGDSRAVISRLETAMPSVAVWSDPQTETTVIWLPEEAGE